MIIVKNTRQRLTWLVGIATLVGFAACSGSDGKNGSQGAQGDPGDTGASCSIVDNGDGTKTITCEDGTTATVSDGTPGADGGSGNCTVVDNNDGTKTITCSDGTSVTVTDGTQGPDGSVGQPGQPGLNAGETPGLVAEIAAAAPANGTHYDANEQIVLTFTLTDAEGNPLTPDQFSTLNLYLSGPRDVLKTVTASALLGASTDRSQRPHHYIDLKDTSNTSLTVDGNVLTYTLQPITTEEAGTYTAGLWAVSADYTPDQTWQLLDLQILTATEEPLIVDGCGDCHTGTNGVTYLHHIDPGRSPYGNPAIDSVPVQTCKNCHNNDGYAAVRVCDDGSYPTRNSAGDYICADGSSNYSYLSDNIVRRAHGVHNGANLTNAYNQSDFGDYLDVHFPADIKNCVKCHSNDDWKTQPSRLACGTCHDAIDWATGDLVPVREEGACTTNGDCTSPATCNTTSGVCETTRHAGGAQTTDNNCSGCHDATAIDTIHVGAVDTYSPQYAASDIAINLSAPANGTHYVAGETPTLTITVAGLDPTTVDGTWNRVRLFVYGPTYDSVPVLTEAAVASTGSYNYLDLRNPGNYTSLTVNNTSWVYTLGDVTGLEPGTYYVFFQARQASGSTSVQKASFQVATATADTVTAANCASCHGTERMHGSYPFEPEVCKACHDYGVQDPSVVPTGWGSSNYGFGAGPLSRRVHRVHFGHYLNTTVPHDFSSIIFPQDVRNCDTCHSENDRWMEEPSRLACMACHDSADAVAHGTLMTVDPTPTQPWSGDELESCGTCHGPGKEFSVENVHNVADPYQPPYPR